MAPELDRWIARPALRVAHRASSSASPADLWAAAEALQVRETGVLGRLIRWRIPGVPAETQFGQLFRSPPFGVLQSGERQLVSGLVGQIWTLRRDYLPFASPDEFAAMHPRGTARVVFAHWVSAEGDGSALHSEARVEPLGRRGWLGVAAVRPLVSSFQGLVLSEGMSAAVRAAERR